MDLPNTIVSYGKHIDLSLRQSHNYKHTMV